MPYPNKHEPADTLPCFPVLQQKLISLLHQLSPEEWNTRTFPGIWTAGDIAAHLLDGNLRGIAAMRDNVTITMEQDGTMEGLIQALNAVNAQGIEQYRRLGQRLVTDLIEWSGELYVQVLQSTDPMAPAIFPVAWAGETQSTNRFHIAREYTEKWHHHQQILSAVEKVDDPVHGILTPELYIPFLDTIFMGLPWHLEQSSIQESIAVEIVIRHPHFEKQYRFFINVSDTLQEDDYPVQCRIILPADIAWRLFMTRKYKHHYRSLAIVEGDQQTGQLMLDYVAVLA